MTKEEIRDKVEDLYIKETDRFAFLNPNKLDDRYIEWLEQIVVKNLTIPFVTKRNWFEKLPLHWRLLYYFIGGIIIGLLLPYVW